MGAPADHWTCHQRLDAKRSRIDGIIVDSEALATIHAFEVENQVSFPTHCTLRIEVCRNAHKEKRTFLQKLRSLKGLLEDKVKGLISMLEGKAATKKGRR